MARTSHEVHEVDVSETCKPGRRCYRCRLPSFSALHESTHASNICHILWTQRITWKTLNSVLVYHGSSNSRIPRKGTEKSRSHKHPQEFSCKNILKTLGLISEHLPMGDLTPRQPEPRTETTLAKPNKHCCCSWSLTTPYVASTLDYLS